MPNAKPVCSTNFVFANDVVFDVGHVAQRSSRLRPEPPRARNAVVADLLQPESSSPPIAVHQHRQDAAVVGLSQRRNCCWAYLVLLKHK